MLCGSRHKKPRKRRAGQSTGLPTKATHPNHVWTWDFVADKTEYGGSIRMLTVLDEYTRECRCIHVDRRINAAKVEPPAGGEHDLIIGLYLKTQYILS